MTEIKTDIVIIGAGIAGLWLANLLIKNGFSCLLIEQNAIGSYQTINSQGMLHSGIKYALQGNITPDMKAISDSEALLLWQQAFNGQGFVKLTESCKLIEYQYLWSNSNLSSKIANFFVSNLFKSKVETVTNDNFSGTVYKLHETVLDLVRLLQELFSPIRNNCLKINNIKLDIINNKINKFIVDVNGEQILLNAERYVFTAGEGISQFATNFQDGPKMQLRPLHMVAVKGKSLPMLYGHNIGLKSIPIISITSYKTPDEHVVWYCGGQIAEEGVNRNKEEQLVEFKKLLNFIFPKLNFYDPAYVWGSFNINRAEHLQPKGKKPNNATWFSVNNAIFAWPTKLVLAPMMVNMIMEELLKTVNIGNVTTNNNFFERFPKPNIASPWWNSL